MPFKNEEFDVVFSFGVIGYTNNFLKAFKEKVRVLKCNGFLGIWVYPQKKGITGVVFNAVRKIYTRESKLIPNLIANITVLFLPLLPTRSKVTLFNSSWKQCLEIVKVNLFPPRLYFFTEKEIENLFLDNNIKIVYKDKNNPITMWGIKK